MEVTWRWRLVAVALAVAAVPAPEAAAQQPDGPPPVVDGSVLEAASDGEVVPVIVTFRDEPAVDVGDIAVDAGISQVDVVLPSIESVAGRVDAGALADLADDPRVLTIEPDLPVTAAVDSARAAIRIPEAALQFGATGDGASDGLHTYSNGDVVIAVVDTGVNRGHLALDQGKVRARVDFAGAAGCAPATGPDWDDNGHGTHVAGIAAGDGDVVTGVAPGAAIIDLKVLCGQTGFQSSVDAALGWVLANRATYGIDVVNVSLSLGGCGASGRDSTSLLANQLVASGVVVVAAAGNAGGDSPCLAGVPGQVTAPAAAHYVLGVGSVAEPSLAPASLSLRGPTPDGRIKPDLAAPGVGITSAHGDVFDATSQSSGTSMASPMVAAVAGLLVEMNEGYRPSGSLCAPSAACPNGVVDGSMVVGVHELLRATATDIAPVGVDNITGWGVVNAYGVFAALLPHGNFDGVVLDIASSTALVQGWAIDAQPARPVEIHVYVAGAFGGFGSASLPRADLAGVFPHAGPNHGFSIRVPVPRGTSSVCAYAIDDFAPDRNRFLGCRTVSVPTGVPFGNLESVTRVPGGLMFAGWAIDPDTAGPVEINLWSSGQFLGWGSASGYRPDVEAVFPAYGAQHGYSVTAAIGPGTHTICAYGINVPNGPHRALGCPTVTVSSTPTGNLDGASRSGNTIGVSGWALDPDVADATELHIYVDGAPVASTYTGGSRLDVAAAWPAYGSNRGFSVTLPVSSGTHRVCAYAINRGPGFGNPLLGCASL